MNTAQKAEFRRQIMRRAEELGVAEEIPDAWKSDGTVKADADDELIAKAEELLRDVRALVPSLTKADDGDGGGEDETEDINGATAAIAAIAKLIISEAESLAMGNFDELCDIQLLCSAADALRWFKCREESEQSDGADMERSDQPAPQTSAPTAEDGAAGDEDEDATTDADEAKADVPTLTKADVTELIEAAVAKAESAAEERTKTLAADLAKAQQTIDELKALPQPGGPVLTRTTLQEAEARKSDAALLRAQAHDYLVKADQCSDRYLADGYREKAQEALTKANA